MVQAGWRRGVQGWGARSPISGVFVLPLRSGGGSRFARQPLLHQRDAQPGQLAARFSDTHDAVAQSGVEGDGRRERAQLDARGAPRTDELLGRLNELPAQTAAVTGRVNIEFGDPVRLHRHQAGEARSVTRYKVGLAARLATD